MKYHSKTISIIIPALILNKQSAYKCRYYKYTKNTTNSVKFFKQFLNREFLSIFIYIQKCKAGLLIYELVDT